MKLLFDQNLSPALVNHLSELYPESLHVSDVNLDQAEDLAVWNYANDNEYIIVSKDSDFNEMGIVKGYPPKVI